MSDDPGAANSLTSGVLNRSFEAGDVPDGVRRRYYVDDRGGAGLGFYVDAKVAAPAFRDHGRQLVAAKSDPNSIRDMTAIARHRGWSIVTARGSAGFRREAWLAGRTVGIEVRGYRPTERDIQELDRRIDRRIAAEDRSQRRRADAPAGRDQRDRDGGDRASDVGAQSRLRVVEAVVRSRVADPAAQSRILTAARDRIAGWLERGARIEPMPTASPRQPSVEPSRPRERQRDR